MSFHVESKLKGLVTFSWQFEYNKANAQKWYITVSQGTKIVHNFSKVHKWFSTIGHEIKNDIFTNIPIRLDMKSPTCPYKLNKLSFFFFLTLSFLLTSLAVRHQPSSRSLRLASAMGVSCRGRGRGKGERKVGLCVCLLLLFNL